MRRSEASGVGHGGQMGGRHFLARLDEERTPGLGQVRDERPVSLRRFAEKKEFELTIA